MNEVNNNVYDIVVVGGGLVGASLLLALKNISARFNLKIALIESKNVNQADNCNNKLIDQRSLVLNLGSKLYYEQLGVWQNIQAFTTPVNKIIVSEQGKFSKVFLDNLRLNVDALGYVINIDLLNKAIWDKLNADVINKADITLLSPCKVTGLEIQNNGVNLSLLQETSSGNINNTVSAKLIIAADGGRSYIRDLLAIGYTQHDYGQSALIANVTHQLENKNTAYERFSKQGPFALLPRSELNNHSFYSGIVWPWSNHQLDYVKNLSNHELLARLQNLFGYKLGKFLDIGQRQFFPLWKVTADSLYKNRVVLLGNAANHLHPIGGQGFNLGLRDVKYFANLLENNMSVLKPNNYSLEQISSLFKNYSNQRTDDHNHLRASTHGLLNLFDDKSKLISIGRSMGMAVCNHSHLLTSLISNQSMGLSNYDAI